MRGKRFEETRPGSDVCHQCYVKADERGTARNARYAFSRIWDRLNLGPPHRNQTCTEKSAAFTHEIRGLAKRFNQENIHIVFFVERRHAT